MFDSTAKLAGEVELNPDVFGIEPNLGGDAPGRHRPTGRSSGRDPQDQEAGRSAWRRGQAVAPEGHRSRPGRVRSVLPICRGGGVAHGPEPRDYSQRTPKKMRRLALHSALSARAAESAIMVIDTFDWDAAEDQGCSGALGQRLEPDGKTLLVLRQLDEIAGVAFRNLPQVVDHRTRPLTAYDVSGRASWSSPPQSLKSVGGGSAYDVSKSDFVKEGEAS